MTQRPDSGRRFRCKVRFQLRRLVTRWLVLLHVAFVLSAGGCNHGKDAAKTTGKEPGDSSRPVQEQPKASTAPLDLAESIKLAVEFLLSQQDQDGLWRSKNYGNLKDGAAITSFVLYSIQDLPVGDKSRLQDAVDKLVPQIRKHGYVTNPEGPDYSNYGSAMLIVACRDSRWNLPDDVQKQLVDYLVRAQLNQDEGYDESSPDWGGWDLSGWITGKRPTTGTTISVAVPVIEALSMSSSEEHVIRSLAAARDWIKRVQNHDPGDGGFFFHPQRDHFGNKAAWHDGENRTQARSYGSATADGLRILMYLGAEKDDPSVQAAIAWLTRNSELTVVPGFDHESGEGSWATGLRYYYYQSLSRSLPLFANKDADRMARRMVDLLLAEQKSDGSWSNTNARMREDDPLIATGFALMTLKNCNHWLEKE